MRGVGAAIMVRVPRARPTMVVGGDPVEITNDRELVWWWGWMEHFWDLAETLEAQGDPWWANGCKNKAVEISEAVKAYKASKGL